MIIRDSFVDQVLVTRMVIVFKQKIYMSLPVMYDIVIHFRYNALKDGLAVVERDLRRLRDPLHLRMPAEKTAQYAQIAKVSTFMIQFYYTFSIVLESYFCPHISKR